MTVIAYHTGGEWCDWLKLRGVSIERDRHIIPSDCCDWLKLRRFCGGVRVCEGLHIIAGVTGVTG